MSVKQIAIDLDKDNELIFNIRIEGTTKPKSTSVRLVCESKDDDVIYAFKGYSTGEPYNIQFDIPKMSNKMQEGVYKSKVEVLIDDRYFCPLSFNLNFKRAFKISEATIKHASTKKDIKITSLSSTPILFEKIADESIIEQITIPEKQIEEANLLENKQNESKNIQEIESIVEPAPVIDITTNAEQKICNLIDEKIQLLEQKIDKAIEIKTEQCNETLKVEPALDVIVEQSKKISKIEQAILDKERQQKQNQIVHNRQQLLAKKCTPSLLEQKINQQTLAEQKQQITLETVMEGSFAEHAIKKDLFDNFASEVLK